MIETKLIIALTLLSFILYFSSAGSIGSSNEYYTAAVISMLQSWQNFFFLAAEPGGSIAVDKPPVGLWIQALSAYLLGSSGFSTVVPNIITGLLCIPLLYSIVKKQHGEHAGLVAAFVLSITPIFIAVNLNNTADSMLLFILLLATKYFINASETCQLGHLIKGAVLVGLGFNIKMLQAFLPLPAFFIFYFLKAPSTNLTKIRNLYIASIIILLVSFSWISIVELTPPSLRPYIGSTKHNSAFELVFDYNGISRVTPTEWSKYALPGISEESFPRLMGEPGMFRFFLKPLSVQMSWLLPLALVSLIMPIFFRIRRAGLEEAKSTTSILWGAWLITVLILFSLSRGMIHPYYTCMLVAPLAALTGIGVHNFWNLGKENIFLIIFTLVAALTLIFQYFMLSQYGVIGFWIILSILFFVIGAAIVLFYRFTGFILLCFSIFVMPIYWSWLTVSLNPLPKFPSAYSELGLKKTKYALSDIKYFIKSDTSSQYLETIDYLINNTKESRYLVAVPSALRYGSEFVVASKRPVIFIGGYAGNEKIISINSLKELVLSNKLRYVIYDRGKARDREILDWLAKSCKVIPQFVIHKNRNNDSNIEYIKDNTLNNFFDCLPH